MSLHTVGLDWRPALFRAFGIGRYVRNLATGILDADPTLRLELLAVFLRGREARIKAYPAPASPRVTLHGMSLPARAWPALSRLGFMADRMLNRAQLFHDTDYFVTPCRKLKRVVTLYDAAWRRELGYVDAKQSVKMERAVRDLLVGDPEIVTISQAAREELLHCLPIKPERVHVTPLAPDPLFALPAAPEVRERAARFQKGTGPYVIHLGTLEPRKNLVMLVKAHALAAARRRDLRLVLLGRKGWRHEELLSAIAESPARDQVQWLGDVPDDVCAALVQGASALAFPTRHEGFGLPAVEGMAAQVPVVLSDLPVLREVAGEAATYVAPDDPSAWADALLEAIEPSAQQRERVARGAAEAARLTWAHCGRATVAAYRACLGRAP